MSVLSDKVLVPGKAAKSHSQDMFPGLGTCLGNVNPMLCNRLHFFH